METTKLDQNKPKVYLETSVVGYFASRRSRDIITAARQEITHTWWENSLPKFQPFISVLVLRESNTGDVHAAAQRRDAISAMPVLEITADAETLAGALISKGAIPAEYPEDALHIAIATVQGMDYLVTWNFTHINNAVLKGKVEQVCEERGFNCPLICSPEELPGGSL